MQLPIYTVDAFTNRLFSGNPAAICPLNEWLPTEKMQQLATENNLSETAFFIKENDKYHIRWFTPEYEIDLCGHATLASAFVLFNYLHHSTDTIHFTCKSGLLEVRKRSELIELNFPSRMPVPIEVPEKLMQGFNLKPTLVLKSRDYFFVYDKEEDVKNIVPDFSILNQFDCIGIIITAKGNEVDFVSRFFVPNSVIVEDPVTGSSHCSLIPYWSGELNKSVLTAKQLSKRGGDLLCEFKGDRVTMAGNAVLYMKGEYYV
jgi:PhzF family phenazine biosynthesis protein